MAIYEVIWFTMVIFGLFGLVFAGVCAIGFLFEKSLGGVLARIVVSLFCFGLALLSIMPLIVYVRTPIPEYVHFKDYELLEIDNYVGAIINDSNFINLTKAYGRNDLSKEKHLYRESRSKGKSGCIIWTLRNKYEIVEKEIDIAENN